MKNKKEKITILAPFYNEVNSIPFFANRIKKVSKKLKDQYELDLVFLNNSSTDNSLNEVLKFKKEFKNTYFITMSRNVGYQASLECGLKNTKGDIFVIIDVDCEDPPELINKFVKKYEEGFDLVYGERVSREELYLIVLVRKVFYRILKRVADDDIILDMAEFSLFSNEVRNAIIQENTSFPFIRSRISRVGFKRIGIPFKREKRVAGSSNYNFVRLFIFALAGILASTTLPLRFSIYSLPWVVLICSLFFIVFLLNENYVYLYSSFFIMLLYLMISISFVAMYLARVYKNGLSRPNAFINSKLSNLQK